MRTIPRKHLAFGVLAGAGFAVGVYLFAVRDILHGPTPQVTEEQVTYLPEFSFPNERGEDVVFATIQAPVRIVNFWASWSPYSKEELPSLAALKREFGDRVEVVALNRDKNPANGRAFLAEIGLSSEITFAYDSEDTYFRRVGGYNMPETVFVGPSGEVLAHVHGPMGLEVMRATVSDLLD